MGGMAGVSMRGGRVTGGSLSSLDMQRCHPLWPCYHIWSAVCGHAPGLQAWGAGLSKGLLFTRQYSILLFLCEGRLKKWVAGPPFADEGMGLRIASFQGPQQVCLMQFSPLPSMAVCVCFLLL